MITNYQKSLLLVSTVLSLGVVHPATAQTSSNAQAGSPQQIEEIIVTATRREERLQDVPISITVFNQQQLSNHNVVNAQDLAAFTPSLAVNSNFGSTNTSFTLRGFEQDIGTQPTVGVFFADVVSPRAPSQQGIGGDGAGPGDFFDLHNVQVLKGPQGTLFGLNTTGGDILLVPQKPTDEFGGYVEGSFGNYGLKGAQGVINIPVNDHVRLRFGVDHLSRDGYLINTTGIGPRDFDDVNYTALRASADIDVTSDLENYTIATYTNSNTHGDFQKLIACDPTASAGASAQIFVFVGGACGQVTPGAPNYQGSSFYDAAQTNPVSYNKLKQWRIINTTTWHASDNLTIKNIASYAQAQQVFPSPLFGTDFSTPDLSFLGPPYPGSYLFNFANENVIPGAYNADQATYTEEFQLQGNAWNNRLIWQAGLYLEGSVPLSVTGYKSGVLINCVNTGKLECSDPVGYLFYLFGKVPEGTPIGSVNYTAGTTNYNDYAAYAQTSYKVTDEITLTGGIRYTIDREANTSTQETYHFGYPGFPFTHTSSCTFPGAPPSCTRSFLEKNDAPTWLLDVDYTPSDNILAYAKYARGYRAGLVSANVVAPYTNTGPERVDTYETGLKTSFDGPVKGTFDIDGFYNDFYNQQLLLGFDANPCYTMFGTVCIPAPVAPTASPVNAGKSHIFGAELESTITPYDGVTLDVSYTYLYTRLIAVRTFTNAPGSLYEIAGAQRVGDPNPLSPRDKVSFTASYELPVDASIGNITLSATFTHTDTQLTNYEDRSYPSMTYVGAAPLSSLSFLPATNLLDLNLNWNEIAGQPVDLSIFATNVTGEKYYTWLPGLAVSTSFETAGIGAPTMYGARVKIHFGED